MKNFSLAGAVALITGAGMGMGRLYALRAASEGAKAVILWDINESTLGEVAAEVRALGAQAVTAVVNVADPNQVIAAASAAETEFGAVDLLVNNAGIVRGGPFWAHDPQRDIASTMNINALAPMYVTRALLPAMMADSTKERRILNIASAAGTLSNPNMSVYAASKWAVIGWSDSLRLELKHQGHANIAVTTFCPSYVSTGMFDGVKAPLLTPLLTPEVAVDRAWRAMLAGQPQRLTPWPAGLAKGLRGVLPTNAWDFIAGNIFKVYYSMDEFRGRGTSIAANSSAAPAKAGANSGAAK